MHKTSLHGSAASSLKPKQHVVSRSFEELSMEFVQKVSYRDSAAAINRVLHREGEAELKHTTLKDRTVSFGNGLSDKYEGLSCDILESYGADPKSGIPFHGTCIPADALCSKPLPMYDETQAKDILLDYNKNRPKEETIKDMDKVRQVEVNAEDCVYISVDDIMVKRQKDERGESKPRNGKYVENTVIHIASKEGQYTLTAIGMRKAFTMLMAFLLRNNLMRDRRLVFLSDGANAIKEHVASFFGFRQYELILDWLHLQKKCGEFLSMSIKGSKDYKHSVRAALGRMLWVGNADDAIGYLRKLESSKVKNKEVLDKLVAYVERKKPYIACYALRKKAGLRISSNRVEKANDLVVANRQKNNGMSWTKNGSGSLATITAASLNGELDYYIRKHEVLFIPIAA